MDRVPKQIHDHHAGLDHCFACDTRFRVLRDDRIEHGVRNLVCNFVGVSLGYGFRGEQKGATHVIFRLVW